MNRQSQVRSLEDGQALHFPRRRTGPLVLTQGELLVQEPARWLAETLVVPAPVRFVGPAVLPATPHCSIVAVRASTVVFQEPASLLSVLLAAAAGMRVRMQHWRLRERSVGV